MRSDRWGLVGLCGIFISGLAVLAFIGYFASDTLVFTGAAQAIAFVLGRAGLLATVAGLLIGCALVIAGARRRPNIDVTHFVAACVFLAALSAMADLAAASTVVFASSTGLPISTTHTLVGAVLGVGLARGVDALDWSVVRNIVVSWVVTLPIAAVLSATFYFVLVFLFT